MSQEHKNEPQSKRPSQRSKGHRKARAVRKLEGEVVFVKTPHEPKKSERPLVLVGVGIDPYDQAQAAREGLKTSILKRLQSKGWISGTEVRVIVDPRTLSHRIARNQPLSVGEADKAIRVARLLEKGLNVFGTQDKVMSWWRRPSERFGKASPLELAKTEHGGRLVEEALVQIEEGMFA